MLFATPVPSFARQNPALAISAPSDGAVVSPGQTFTVTVTSPAGQTFNVVGVLGEEFIGFAGSSATLPAQFQITVPANAVLRKYLVSAVGSTGSGEPIITSIAIDVQRPDLPSAIRADIAQLEFRVQGEGAPTRIRATFSDGAVLDATRSTNMTFVSSNPNVAEIDVSEASPQSVPGWQRSRPLIRWVPKTVVP